ncbi:MAG TPA: DNA-processing protein DprA, partial [bacterium]|nr:DNA-processing protein DprA [bacterium]
SPPPVVFVRGDINIKTELAACVVGTRQPTPYGLKVAEHLGAALSRSGICTVSGGARGIDAQAHRGAMAAGGPTVAVLGRVRHVQPRAQHVTLFEQIVASGGALLGELPPGTPPLRGSFPARNRLLAGLGRACVVVEAGEKSGALITARLAMEQGKTVLAVPGRIDRAQSRGVNRLIRDGAKPLLEILDVVEEVLGEHLNRGRAEDEIAMAMRAQLPPPPGDAGKIWDRLVGADADADELAEKTGLSAAQVNAALLELELAGRVRRLPGNRYAVTQEV